MLVSNTSRVLRLLSIPVILIIYCSVVYLKANASFLSIPPLLSTDFSSSFPATDGTTTSSLNLTQAKSTFGPAVKDFWNELAGALEAARPQCSPVQIKDGHPSNLETKFEPLNLTKTPPARLLNFTDKDETALLTSHYRMRASAQRLAPRLVFSAGLQGVVTTANAKYMPIFLVSLRMLRKTGCQLPVEVFIDDWTKYDPVICESVLPSMNAACVVLSEVYNTASNIQQPTSYQFKLFAMLFSSFQHILFLDSDAFPAHDPTALFITPPYTTHGLVVWPDLFGLTVSEHFYHIAAIPYESPSSRPSTESSIVLLDKEKHRASLLLMVYYNYYGPDYYYPLLCQGSHGAGDKETFVPAAMSMGLPWYQVRSGVAGLGYFDSGAFRMGGLAQMDPRTDFLYKPPSPSHAHRGARWDAGLSTGEAVPKPLFVHQNMHKLNPARILTLQGSTAKLKAGNYTRMWGKLAGALDLFGYDIERRAWEAIIDEGCRLDARSAICADLKAYFGEVFGGDAGDG